MEDALVQSLIKAGAKSVKNRLNPCFNGRCTSTELSTTNSINIKSLNPCFNGRCTSTAKLQ